MEFKCYCGVSVYESAKILIESQWNLNAEPFAPVSPFTPDINRITVEFKLHCGFICCYKRHILIESQWNLNSEVPAFPAVTATY